MSNGSFPNDGLDYIDSSNSSGTTGVDASTTTDSTTGAVINTAQNPLPAPDASGGNGSFLSTLQTTLTSGLNDGIVSATEFGLGALNDRLAANASGNIRPAAAQGVPPSFAGASIGKWLILGALGFLVYKAAKA